MITTLMVSIVATLISYAQPQAAQRHIELSVPQTECLTEAIYFESRGEGTIGSTAVSYVVLNRAALEDKSICDVIHEKFQFSFYNPYTPFHVHELSAWKDSAQIAINTQLGILPNPIGNATLYNTIPVRSWKSAVFVKKIRHHYFYRLPYIATNTPLVIPPKVTTISFVKLLEAKGIPTIQYSSYVINSDSKQIDNSLPKYVVKYKEPGHYKWHRYHRLNDYKKYTQSQANVNHHWLQIHKVHNIKFVRAQYYQHNE